MTPTISRFRNALGVALALALMSAACPAQTATALRLTESSFLDLDAQLPMAAGHPNELLRIRGLKSHVSGHDDEAIDSFRRAAAYADKFSQHYLSLLYWNGQGTPVDRVQAYIWSDLAAERGGRELVLLRERMWRHLDEAERDQVRAQGANYYAQYGDRVAKPRMEYELRRFSQQLTGSRVGYNPGNVQIAFGPPGGDGGGTDARDMYADARVRPDAYWTAENEKLGISNVRVEVGPVERTRPQRPPGGN